MGFFIFILVCTIIVGFIVLYRYDKKVSEREKSTPQNKKSIEVSHNDFLEKQISVATNDEKLKYLNTTIANLSKEIDLLQKKNDTLLQENSNYIKENKELNEILHEFNPYDDYRKRFPSPYRCEDGDWVRSKAEREIDNFFYKHRIWHIIEEVYYKKNSDIKYYPDFYLPDYNLYLEYFGGTDSEYLFKREAKIATYRSDYSIRFEYLTFQDDTRIEERLKEICRKYSISL